MEHVTGGSGHGAPGFGVPVPDAGRVIAVGIDVVAVERFRDAVRRTPTLPDRLFAPDEQVTPTGQPRSVASLAVRFAVKEAVAKALGVPVGLRWHDCRVVSEANGQPHLTVDGTVAAAAERLGVARWQISLSHDAGIAAAIVVALGGAP